jgi:phage tail protein X
MRTLTALAVSLSLCLATPSASALVHVVQRGDTLASIAEHYYGKIQLERLLVVANALDADGGISIHPGMRLEVPLPWHHRVEQGDTWKSLASRYLGAEDRYVLLATANHTSSWVQPEEGAELVIPFNLTFVSRRDETISSVAFRYLGSTDQAWMLTQYNDLQGALIRRGDLLLIPLSELPLTAAAKTAIALESARLGSQALGEASRHQGVVRLELPALVAEVRQGRYVDAIQRGNHFLAAGTLSRVQLAQVQRQLLEAYVAVGARGLAAAACKAWLAAEPHAQLDPAWLSPKILNACTGAR